VRGRRRRCGIASMCDAARGFQVLYVAVEEVVAGIRRIRSLRNRARTLRTTHALPKADNKRAPDTRFLCACRTGCTPASLPAIRDGKRTQRDAERPSARPRTAMIRDMQRAVAPPTTGGCAPALPMRNAGPADACVSQRRGGILRAAREGRIPLRACEGLFTLTRMSRDWEAQRR
jgi:hypothetical protein